MRISALVFCAGTAIVSVWCGRSASRLWRLLAEYQKRADAADVESYFARLAVEESLARRESLRLAAARAAPYGADERRTFAAIDTANDQVIAHQVQRASYWIELRRKYTRAVARPWEAVEPDPPVPVLIVPPAARSHQCGPRVKSL